MLRCPYCKQKIEQLNYRVGVTVYMTEFGVYYPEEDNYEPTEDTENEREYNYDYIYECPNCGEGITLAELEEQQKDKDLNLDNLSKKYEVLSHTKTE